MRYTRYDLKKRNKNNIIFLLLTIGILILAFISGSIISNMFIKNIEYNTENVVPEGESNNSKVEKNGESNKESGNLKNTFYAIQCGVFTNKDNAKALKEKIASMGTSFIIEEENKSRVIMGVYEETNLDSVLKRLSDNKIDFSKITLKIENTDYCNTQIAEIINAYMQINNKFLDEKVKSVQSKGLKEWTSTLKEVEKDSINYKALESMKGKIKDLPEQITKSDLESINLSLFNIIKELK